MRAYRPSQHSDKDTCSETHQIVVSVSVQKSLIATTNNGYTGHLGIRKTYLKLLDSFHWPGIRQDVSDFVRTYHTSHVVGKSNQPIPVGPLKRILIVREPFEKVIIDCVGPLPRTK